VEAVVRRVSGSPIVVPSHPHGVGKSIRTFCLGLAFIKLIVCWNALKAIGD